MSRIQRPDRPAEVLERQTCVVVGGQAAGVAGDDLGRDGLEGGAEAVHAFERDHGAVGGVDAVDLELLLVEDVIIVSNTLSPFTSAMARPDTSGPAA